jgi:large subunit ribosomal protein L32e
MSKKPTLSEVPGVGQKMEEKLREAGIKTVLNLSRAKPDKLSAKVEGLSEAGATKLISAAQGMLPTEEKTKPKPRRTTAEEKPKPKKNEVKAKAEPKKPAKKAAAKKAEPKPKKKAAKKKESEVTKRESPVDKRLMRIAQAKKRRKPQFRHDQAHRWIRVSDSWRKVRGIDSKTREKKRGYIKMASAGYRTPKAVRGIHPSAYIEVRVERPLDLEGLDPQVHAIRIGATVGLRKRQEILKKADAMTIRVLNPGAPEAVEEEDLFTDLEDLEDLEVD